MRGMVNKLCVVIVGPTASGKSSIALQIAKLLDGEIVCMDSATVYRQFDIGTSKPTVEEQKGVPHHLLDILDPNEPFSAGHFVERTQSAIEEIESRGKLPIVVGGTYFYLRALQNGMYPTPVIPNDVIEGIEKEFLDEERTDAGKMHEALQKLDPESAKNIHPNDRYRLLRAHAILRTTQQRPSELKAEPKTEFQQSHYFLKYAICVSRHQLSQAIVKRTERMLTDGLVDEVKKLKEAYPSSRALGSIGYNETCAFLNRQITEKQLRNEIIEKTRQLAKRQITWLRSDPEIRYIDFRDIERIQLEIDNLKFVLSEAV